MKYSIHVAMKLGTGESRTTVIESFATKREAIRAMSKWKLAWRRGQFRRYIGTEGFSGFTAVRAGTFGYSEAAFIGNFRGVARARFTLMKNIEGAAS
jgi:hypothetical protein